MLTTEGFRDVTHIGRHRKPHNFSLQQTIPWQEQPIVERRHRKEISERIQPPGEVVTPLDEDDVRRATEELIADGIESVAVCYLHSYLDPTHEQRTKEILEEEFPDLPVSTSNEVIAQFREFERFTTTAINARLEPVMSTYLERLHDRLTDEDINSEVLVIQSNGGLASINEVEQMPVTTLLSGPSAGVLSAEFEGKSADEEKIIAFDMGGTSADISVYPGHVLERDARDSKVGGYPAIVPMLDIETIGSGGGSIAWLDRANGFNVGPKSAGADPGPACYGLGNDQPTVTDAQVVLGRIDPDTFLGGKLDIDPQRSEKALEEYLCEPLDQQRFATPENAALAVLELANINMYRAIREQTVQRGYDPREYTIVAFGGVGPMHATDIADELEASKVLVPPSPGIASARGLLTADVQYDNQVTLSRDLREVATETVEEWFDELGARGRERLEADEIDSDKMVFKQTVDCLYEGQGYELNVDFDDTNGEWRQRIRDRFERKHEAEYGHYFEEDPVELLNIRVSAIGRISDFEASTLDAGGDVADAKTGESSVIFGSSLEPRTRTVPRYARNALRAGHELEGPAIVDQPDSTVVVKPDWRAEVLHSGALSLTRK
jgi:N-methylhydantoinase A